jgi:multidrug efflux system outer membrane protein
MESERRSVRRASIWQIVRARADAGLVSDLDVNQAEANRASLAAQIKELRRQRAAAVHQLGVLAGNLDLQLEAGDIRSLPTPPLPPAGLPSALLERRADVRRSEAAVVAANARIGVARAAQFPTLSLTAALGAQSAALGNLLASGAGIWSFGLGVVGPIFDAGLYAARTEQAEAQARQTAIEYEQTVETAFREVADALAVRDSLAERLDAQQAQVEAAERSLTLAEQSYRLGGASQLELLDAQRQLAASRQGLVTLRQIEQANRVVLLRALGGRWTEGG